MYLVNRLRRAQGITLRSFLHPFLVVPVVIQIPEHGSGSRRLFTPDANRISLVDAISVTMGIDVELVKCAVIRPGDESFPDAGRAARIQAMSLRIPSVEAPDDRYRARVRRPYTENGSRLTLLCDEMGSHFVVNAVMAALIEKVKVVLRQQLGHRGHSLRHDGGLRGIVYRTNSPTDAN